MHPMFVKLFMETDADDLLAEEQDQRRRTRQARRGRSARVLKVAAANQDRPRLTHGLALTDEPVVTDEPARVTPGQAFENSGMFAPLAALSGPSSSATISSATSAGVSPGRSSGFARASISVSTAPGLTQIALTPSSRPSVAIASVSPTTPYLETL